MTAAFRPRLITEPLTRLQWVAKSRADVMLAWWPLCAVALAFILGVAVGYTAWMTAL